MSYIFGMPLRRHARLQIEKVVPPKMRFWKSVKSKPDEIELFNYQHAFTTHTNSVGAVPLNAPPPTSNGKEQEILRAAVKGVENFGTRKSTQSVSSKSVVENTN
jgi:hypothetical protein